MEITRDRKPASSSTTGSLTDGVRIRRSRRRRHKRESLLAKLALASGVLLAALTAYGIVVVIRIGQASIHLSAAKEASQKAASAVSDNEFETARSELKKASDEFVRSRNLLSALEVKVLRKVPVVGPNIKAVTAIALAGSKVTDAGALVLEELRIFEDEEGRVRFPYERGHVDVGKIEALREPFRRAVSSVSEGVSIVQNSPTTMLFNSVSQARTQFIERIDEVRVRLEEASLYLDIAPELLGIRGRRTYLVAIGNNAEMNAGGMVLAYGILNVDNGSLAWSRVGSITELQLQEPVSVAQEPGYEARWSWANPNFAWQRTNVSIDTRAAGSSMAAMFHAKTGGAVDGVIYVDGVAIGYLLSATGPLKFDNPKVTLDTSNFADYTMNRAYFDFGNQTQRKEFLVEAAARAIEASFKIRGSGAEQLAKAISKATSERRLWMWASESDIEDKLSKVALGGSAHRKRAGILGRSAQQTGGSGDIATYTLINLSGNKVDYYIFNSISHKLEIDSGGSGRVTVYIEIENRAPPGLPEYIGGAVGPGQAQRERGEYLGYFTWYAPLGSELVDAGTSEVQSDLPDGGMAAFSWSVRVAPGSRESLRFSYRLPDSYLSRDAAGNLSYTLDYVPQPRIRPDKFSSEVVLEGGGKLFPALAYSQADDERLYYSDFPSSTTRLEVLVRLAGS